MWEKMESDKRLRKEVETMNNEVENVRNLFPVYRSKVKGWRSERIDVEKDVFQKLELVEIQVKQMKFSLADFSKHLRDRRDQVGRRRWWWGP